MAFAAPLYGKDHYRIRKNSDWFEVGIKNVREWRRQLKTGQSMARETGNIKYTRQRKTNKNKTTNTICVRHHYGQRNW